MKYKTAENIFENSSEDKIQEARYGLFVYDECGNEYHISMTNDGDLRVTSHNGTISILPQAMNQLIIKQNK